MPEQTEELPGQPELVIITGLSGSGKGTVLKVLEDLGYYAVDNLPLDLIPKFAELTLDSYRVHRAALVVDIREGATLDRFPELYHSLRNKLSPKLVFLEASDDALVRRFSETRRPHPLGGDMSLVQGIRSERERLKPIRDLADYTVDTSKFTVHELRDYIRATFSDARSDSATMLINVLSFGYRHGVPSDADLVLDVRFLPNPNYIPRFKQKTGLYPAVADYIRGFPQTKEFIERTADLLQFLLPYYIREGKSYLTVAFGCTGGQHRSVMMTAEMRGILEQMGYRVKETHRDIPR
jgi:UPF0042 nucleotide-binding protein